jgi:hypothetical protein
MKTKIIGLLLLILSEILIIYLFHFDNYFPKWHTIRPFDYIGGLEYDRLQLVHERLQLVLFSSITITSLIGGLLLMITSNSFKYTIKVYGITILIAPIAVGIMSVFNIVKNNDLAGTLLVFIFEYLLSFPFLLLLLFFVQFINKKEILVRKKKMFISLFLLFLLIIIITCLLCYEYINSYIFLGFSLILVFPIIVFVIVLFLNVLFIKLKPDKS